MPHPRPQSLDFDRFTLDPVRSRLLCGERVLPLRHQSFEVLRYLAERAGAVIASDELVAALWANPPADPGASVVQCVREIRRALGQEGRWIVKTVPGHGYQFMAEVVHAAPAEASAAPTPLTITDTVGDPSSVEGAAVEPMEQATAEPAIAELSAGAARSSTAVRSSKPAWLARLDRWSPAAQAVGHRHIVVAFLLLLAFGAFLLPRGRSISAPVSVSAPTAPMTMQAVPTVAMLPFKATDHPAGAVAAAFGEEIRSELGRSTRYLDLDIRSGGLGEAAVGQLASRYVVAGTVLGESRDREPTVTIRLTEAETGRLIWSESRGLEPGDGAALNRLAARFARALTIQIRLAESRRPLPPSPEAGHYAMMGHAVGQNMTTAHAVGEALALFRKALAIDDNSSSAQHGLAWARLVQVVNSYIPADERPAAIAEANSAIDRLLVRDPRNPATHFLRGNVFRARKEVAEAIAAYEYTLSLNPNHQGAHAALGRMMIEVGEAKLGIARIELAIRLHPSDPWIHSAYYWAGMAALHAGEDRAAVDWLLKARLANPQYPYAMLWLAMAYCAVGDMEKARANLAEYSANGSGVSLNSFRRSLATSNPVVAEQRERLAGLLRKLGVAEGSNAPAQK